VPDPYVIIEVDLVLGQELFVLNGSSPVPNYKGKRPQISSDARHSILIVS
jgi:hypothetical protein